MLKACTATVAVSSLYRLKIAITQPTGMLQPDFYYLLYLTYSDFRRFYKIGRFLSGKDTSFLSLTTRHRRPALHHRSYNRIKALDEPLSLFE